MNHVNEIEQQVSSWPGVSVHAHRFGGTEFRCDRAEIGHVHTGGTVDIPFSRAIRDALLAKGLAEEHRWAPIRVGSRSIFAARTASDTRCGS